ncbi:hypothetical protein AA14_26375, partial [Salmonella enterica]|nr:hypothetical protein [Salmonella enterica]ECX6013210.1 hypothetical protein [Salmonella enterica subsp. enterica serovar Rubislaw]EEJ9528592.1 hypothetical protein [Salmonella enterica subsp. enterica serovar Rubislaw]
MAVENKFKINVIAASVLMGLSLSAMTSAVAVEKKEAEVAPAPAKTTLAEAVKAVKPDGVTFDKGEEAKNPSQKANLQELIAYLGDGSAPAHDVGIKSVNYARGKLAEKYQTAGAGAKATAPALQNLVAFNRATAAAMVKLDTAALEKAMEGKQAETTKISNEISAELKKLPDADSKNRAAYEAAIADFLKLSPEDQAKPDKQNELKTKLTKEGGSLVSDAEISDIFAKSDVAGGFKTYDELLEQTNSNPSENKLASHVDLIKQQGDLSNALS